jgi:septal ring factor EnvC (AmiA/AmiB activator)
MREGSKRALHSYLENRHDRLKSARANVAALEDQLTEARNEVAILESQIADVDADLAEERKAVTA